MKRSDLATVTEKDWQTFVVQLAQLSGWSVYHTFFSNRSASGWPDLVLMRPPELVIAELKSESGKVTVSQQAYIEGLTACGIETHVWRPSDQQAVIDRLRRTRVS